MYRIEDSTVLKDIRLAEKLVKLMDSKFKIPFINFRFGIDPLIGLVPWVGDVVSFLISALIIKSLVSAGLPRPLIINMIWNIILDLGIGSVPVLGDIWDFFNKANRKNLKLAKEHFETHGYKGK